MVVVEAAALVMAEEGMAAAVVETAALVVEAAALVAAEELVCVVNKKTRQIAVDNTESG